MVNGSSDDPNLAYQAAPSQDGGSYTEKKIEKLKLPLLKGKRFLDLGCNIGYYCNFAHVHGAERVVGIDVDRKVIENARALYPNVEFFDTGWDIFPHGGFDIIIMLSAIHYAIDPIQLVENIRSHLVGGGVFILEGGLVDAGAKLKTNILIPGWRQVGDRCRHLSHGFVNDHLLRRFSWEIIGPSEHRGGDDVPRYVIHATPKDSPDEQCVYQLDLLEYAQCLMLSAATIVSSMPSYNYVVNLGKYANIASDNLVSILSTESNWKAFVNDLLFALGEQRPLRLQIQRSMPETFIVKLAQALNECDVNVDY